MYSRMCVYVWYLENHLSLLLHGHAIIRSANIQYLQVVLWVYVWYVT